MVLLNKFLFNLVILGLVEKCFSNCFQLLLEPGAEASLTDEASTLLQQGSPMRVYQVLKQIFLNFDFLILNLTFFETPIDF
jgi:hypothetical protein